MRKPKAHVEVSCACCGEIGPHNGRSLRKTCYLRHFHAGTLDNYPPLGETLTCLWRRQNYAELRERGKSLREAAERLGVHQRTAERYEARLKAAA